MHELSLCGVVHKASMCTILRGCPKPVVNIVISSCDYFYIFSHCCKIPSIQVGTLFLSDAYIQDSQMDSFLMLPMCYNI